MSKSARGIFTRSLVGLASLSVILLSGCWDDNPRPMVKYTPGVYKGKPDTPVSDEALIMARERAMNQAGLAASVPRGVAAPSSSVRPPSGATTYTHPADTGLSRAAQESQRAQPLRGTSQ